MKSKKESYALTRDEITRLECLFDKHMAGYAMACDLADFARRRNILSSLVSSYLLSIGFVRLTDDLIATGCQAYELSGRCGITDFREAIAMEMDTRS